MEGEPAKVAPLLPSMVHTLPRCLNDEPTDGVSASGLHGAFHGAVPSGEDELVGADGPLESGASHPRNAERASLSQC